MNSSTTPIWLREFVAKNFPCTFNAVEEPGFEGLTADWPAGKDQLTFVNCAFTDAQLWIEKAAKELKKGAASILFVPFVANAVYFRETVYPYAAEIHILTCPIKIPGKSKQIVTQTALVVFAGRDAEIPAEQYPLLFLAHPENWAEEYYKRPRNRARFAEKK